MSRPEAMYGTALVKGQNCALPAGVLRLQLVVAWDEPAGPVAVDAGALLLTDARRVRSDEDFVFFNQPASPDGSLRHLARPSGDAAAEERIALDLSAVPAEVAVVAVTASVLEGSFGDLRGLRLLVLDDAADPLVSYDITGATTETAFVFGEVYRRGQEWKVRAVGQGWDSGLAGLATDFGVTVDDSPEEDAPPEADVLDGATEPAAPATPTTAITPPEADAPDTDDGQPADATAADAQTAPDPDTVAGDSELVDVVEPPQELASTVPAQLVVPPAATTAPPSSPNLAAPPARTAGVRTRKSRDLPVAVPRLKLAGAESWDPARLFSISGVGTADEQEKRATSVLLATMLGVPAFARALTGRFGAPAGAVETYLEVPFTLGETTVRPDGVIRVARGGIWTGLLEVKTGSGQLRKEQIENYLDVAREQRYDAVITLSNEIAPQAGEHPVVIDKRKLRGTIKLVHLSWAEVLHEAKMTLAHRGAGDPLQAWLMAELIRYLEHPRSGAATFDDMGPAWVPVREAIAAGTLRPSDRKVPTVATAWTKLVRQVCLRLSSELGVTVTHVLPRKLATDQTARVAAIVTRLAAEGVMDAVLKVPHAAGPVTLTADLRTGRVGVSVQVAAPQEGTAQRRVTWLLRQLREAPDDLLVEALFMDRADSTCEKLGDVRANPAALMPDRSAQVAHFRLTRTSTMGTKRSGVRDGFASGVSKSVEAFYSTVVQPLKPWVPPAPKLPDDVTADAVAEQIAEAPDHGPS